jgi:dolichyldiphosphatase
LKTAVSAGCVFAALVVSVSRYSTALHLFYKSKQTMNVIKLFRVYLMYHTVTQVIIGALLGSILAIHWFLFVHFAFTPFFPTIASWWDFLLLLLLLLNNLFYYLLLCNISRRICEWLLIRDQTLIPNIIW